MNITLIYLVTKDNGEIADYATSERLIAVVDNEKELHKIVDKHHDEERRYQADESIPQLEKDLYDTSIRTEEITLNKLIN